MNRVISILLCGAAACSIACEIGPQSGAGLRLPNGDLAKGKQAFSDLGCEGCHSIAGEERRARTDDGHVVVVLGGNVPHIESHGELITSIVNPSHGFSRRYPREEVMEEDRSRMQSINEQMTVQQLIDLTAYLQSKYHIELTQVYGP
jgi:hypothetical protein